VPLVHLHAEHRLYVPSFGGLFYDRTTAPALISLGGAPFWEAPVMALEGPRGSLGLWVEDGEFRPHFAFLSYDGRSFSASIEYLNWMPFEDLKQASSFVWRLDAFAGGWVEAMTPYRNWYAQQFAPERKLRAATQWADKIRVVIDRRKDAPANARSRWPATLPARDRSAGHQDADFATRLAGGYRRPRLRPEPRCPLCVMPNGFRAGQSAGDPTAGQRKNRALRKHQGPDLPGPRSRGFAR
jgi:hypothetical protein